MNQSLTPYLPQDRRRALAEGRDLPERSTGSALFADIAGFTPLTSALIEAIGQRRGVEELPRHLNRVYEALIAEVERFGGSVVGFSGDGITCWFDQADGSAAARATACGLGMQQAMAAFAAVPVPHADSISLTLKVGIATGPARRFVVGNPDIRLIDVLAGETLVRMAAAEHVARQGEVVVDATTAEALGDALQAREWHSDTRAWPYAVVAGLGPALEFRPPAATQMTDGAHDLRPWVHDAVAERLMAGQGDLLTELRPAVALFLRFEGIEYDADDAAGEKLDRYIRWVQGLLAEYDGTLIQVTMGEKGSYLYVAFGAPMAHEDDAQRAAQVALALRDLPAELSFITNVQIGISRGTMRTGAYGSETRRTYGVLGEETNLAARLMMLARAGKVLASERVQGATERYFTWQPRDAVPMQGWAESVPAWELVGQRLRETIHLLEPQYALPMVGRAAELAFIQERMRLAARGDGQIIGITAEAGMGKSRLVTEVVRRAQEHGFTVYGGEAQSYGTHTPYLVWQPIWRAFFDLDASLPVGDQVTHLTEAVETLDPSLLPRLPLLGTLLNFPLPDNDVTRAMDAKARKEALEALLVACVKAATQPATEVAADALAVGPSAGTSKPPLLFVLEDLHWADALSRDLLTVLGRAAARLPVVLLLAYRPLEGSGQAPFAVQGQAHFTEVMLAEFKAQEAEALIRQRLAQVGVDPRESDQAAAIEALTTRLMGQAEGNPFYLEELLLYLHERGLDMQNLTAWQQVELPNSLHRLILSRMDQLTERQQRTLKVASIIGRLFQVAWLHGYYPDLGEPEAVRAELQELSRVQLTLMDTPEPELSYLFKHVITQEVAYESLTFATRARLHEQLARFIERMAGENTRRYLDLLAFHYGRSANDQKRREYLRRAGEAAQLAYANETALHYYEQLLPLLEPAERVDVLLQLSKVLELVGRWDEGEAQIMAALALTTDAADHVGIGRCQAALANLVRLRGDYDRALEWLAQAEASFLATGAKQELVRVVWTKAEIQFYRGQNPEALATLERQQQLAEEIGDLRAVADAIGTRGLVLWIQRAYQEAVQETLHSIEIAESIGYWFQVGRGALIMGIIHDSRNDDAAAVEWHHRAIEITRKINDRQGELSATGNLALVYFGRGDRARALAILQQVLQDEVTMGNKWAVAIGLSNIGGILGEIGETVAAERFLQKSISLGRHIGYSPGTLASTLVGLSELYAGQHRYAEAHVAIREALQAFEQAGGVWHGIGPRLLKAHILAVRLPFLLGQRALSDAVAELEKMLADAETPEEQAELHYGLWQLDPTRAADRQRAAELYHSLHDSAPYAEYRERYAELTGTRLPDPPPLPELDGLPDAGEIDMAELLAEVDRWLDAES